MKIINIDVIGTRFIKMPGGAIMECEPIKPQTSERYHVYWFEEGVPVLHARAVMSTAVRKFFPPSEYPEMYI